MKKIIWILLLSILTINVFSQESKVDSGYVTNNDVEKLVDKYSAKIEASIISIGQTLKQPAEHVYKILIKQQVVKAWTWLIINISLLLLIILTILPCFFSEDYKDELWGIPVLIGIIFLIVIAGSISTIIGGFINPEYGAIQDIINIFK